MNKLRELAIAGSDTAVYKVIHWCYVDLGAEVSRRFSIDMEECTVGKLLAKLKLTSL